MKTFQEFAEGLNKAEYKSIRKAKKPFGSRIIYHKKGTFSDKRILIYVYSRKEPRLPDFTKFLNDFRRFFKTTEEKGISAKGAFFLVDKSCPKRLLKGLKEVLKQSSDLAKKVKIIQLRT